MKLALSESQQLLEDTVARLFEAESTPQRVRAAEATGFDAALWRQLVDLGLVTMRAAAPDAGGSSLLDAAIVASQAGRWLASAPLVEAIVAVGLLHRVEAPPALLERVDAGAVASLALDETRTGRRQIVPGGAVAEIIVGYDGASLFAVNLAEPAARVGNIAAAPLASLDLTAGERTVLATGASARQAWEAAQEEWRLLNAAFQAGLGRRAIELAAGYSAERIQFGKPIGSFQAIAHPLADSATDIAGAQLLVWRAIWDIAAGRQDAAAHTAMASWWASAAADAAVRRAVRTFGGYGVSLEYDVQLYFRRAKLHALLTGKPQDQLDRVAARLWLDEQPALPEAGDVEIDFGFGAEAEAYAAELRAFVTANMSPDVEKKKHHSTSGHHPGFHKRLAEAGHAFPDIAVDGRPARSRYEVMAAAPLWEDLNWTRTPIAVTEFVAKMCQLWSQPEAKTEILGRILAGDALACLGFSEPGAGSDVFSCKLSARREGDDWVMNGQKMFTTNAHNADYILILARTDNTGKKHQGLTMFIMPLKSPGVDIHPVYTLQDERTNIVYFSDVRTPDKYRIGDVGQGARVMASALGFEQGGAGYHAAQTAMLKHAVAWARKPRGDAGRPLDDLTTRGVLARAAINDAVAEVLCRRQIWSEDEGVGDPAIGPMAKMFSTETMYSDASAILEVAAPESLVRGLDSDLDIVETTMRRAVAMTIYGGTSEVHRSLIAEKSLGMPKSRE